LIISSAKDNQWRQRGFDYLRRQLGVLAANRGITRKGYKPDPGFRVLLNAPGFEGGVGDLREQIIDATWGTLIAEVNKDGKGVCRLTAKGLGGKPKEIVSKKIFKHLTGVKLKLGILVQNKDDFRKPSVLSKNSAQEIANEWGGVQLRYNGFRVIPYGDDDWLEIDRDRARRLGKPNDDQLFDFAHGLQRIDPSRTLLNALSMKSYVGTVETDNKADGLVMKVDRQGLVENESFHELKEFVRFAIDWANIYRDFYVQSQTTEEVGTARRHLETVLNKPVADDELVPSAVNYLRKEIRSLTALLPEDERKEKQELLLRTTRALEAGTEANLEKLRHLRLLASASTLTLLFSHEIKSLLGALSGGAASIAAVEKLVPKEHREEIRRIGKSLAEAKSRFSDLIDMTGIVGDVNSEAEAEPLNLYEVIARSVKCFNVIKEKYQIDISYVRVPRHLAVGPMVQGEIYAIVINLLSNAIKSVIAAGKEKLIEFEAKRGSNGMAIIHVKDSGLGLSEEHFEEAFHTFISDPEGKLYDRLQERLNPQDAQLFGTGSGLGLSIVKDIITARKGSIKFCEPEGGWKAILEIQLP
jgi:signal transduction histidine kinase